MSVTVSLVLSWVDADGTPYIDPPRKITCPGMPLKGCIDVPAGTVSGTEFDIPFTGQTKGASFVLVENETGQELNAAWGGEFQPHMAASGWIMYAGPGIPASGSITALRFMLTQQQASSGKLSYLVCGC